MVKKLGVLILLAVITLFVSSSAYAVPTLTTYTLNPKSGTLGSLSEGSFELWDINWAPPTGQTIVSATLYIDNIYNQDGGKTNLLSIFLDKYVTTPHSTYGLTETGHNSNSTSWGGNETSKIESKLEQALIGTFHDPHPVDSFGDHPHPQDISFSFNSTLLNDLITDDKTGNFALGFDPDCHFFDTNVYLKIVTTSNPGGHGNPTPEPATFSLLGLGFAGLFGLKRKKN